MKPTTSRPCKCCSNLFSHPFISSINLCRTCLQKVLGQPEAVAPLAVLVDSYLESFKSRTVEDVQKELKALALSVEKPHDRDPTQHSHFRRFYKKVRQGFALLSIDRLAALTPPKLGWLTMDAWVLALDIDPGPVVGSASIIREYSDPGDTLRETLRKIGDRAERNRLVERYSGWNVMFGHSYARLFAFLRDKGIPIPAELKDAETTFGSLPPFGDLIAPVKVLSPINSP